MNRLGLVLLAGAGVAALAAITLPNAFPHPQAIAGPVPVGTAQVPDNDPARRRALFGELHLHTAYSFDAYSIFGVRTTPDEAYRFARGEPIMYLGQKVQRSRPLDFTAVTDHAEYLGLMKQLNDPDSILSRSE